MADKYEVKKYIASKIGEEFVIPCYNAWTSANEINVAELPQQFVLKCNHNSGGGMFICKDKSKIDADKFNAVKAKLQKNLNDNYYKYSREWPYKDIKPKIICEKFIENADKSPLIDYKFYCYGEEPRYFMYSIGEANAKIGVGGHAVNHKFNMQCESIDYLFKKHPAIKIEDIKLPENINDMIEIVKILCKGFQHIRVDLYNVDGKIYFGEFTFYSGGGFINVDNQEYAQYLADLIDLNKILSGETC